MEQDNRESWLNRVAIGMAPLFDVLDAPLPDRIRVAIGFTSAGRKGTRSGPRASGWRLLAHRFARSRATARCVMKRWSTRTWNHRIRD